MKLYVLETVSEVDGGYLPDCRRVQGVFSSYELAEQYAKDNYEEEITEITTYNLDEEEDED